MSRRAGRVPPRHRTTTVRSRYRWLRWTALASSSSSSRSGTRLWWDQLAKAWRGDPGRERVQWVLSIIPPGDVDAATSRRFQRRLPFRGVPVRRVALEAALYAATHWAPRTGGPVLSATFMYRQRILGAPWWLWQLVMSGALQVVVGCSAWAARSCSVPEQSLLAAVHHQRFHPAVAARARSGGVAGPICSTASRVQVLPCGQQVQRAAGLADGWRKILTSSGR